MIWVVGVSVGLGLQSVEVEFLVESMEMVESGGSWWEVMGGEQSGDWSMGESFVFSSIGVKGGRIGLPKSGVRGSRDRLLWYSHLILLLSGYECFSVLCIVNREGI